MKVVDFLRKNLVIADLTSRGKVDTLAELADHIAREEQVSREDVHRVLVERERLGSTGIGEGVAIPHGTMSSLTHLVALFARSVEGIDFDAIDGRRTNLFFVLLTPDNNVGLQALARVSRMMRRPEFRQTLMTAGTQDELYRTIVSEDERL